MKFNPPKDKESEGEKRTVRKFAFRPTLMGNIKTREYGQTVWLEWYSAEQVWIFHVPGFEEGGRMGWQWFEFRRWQNSNDFSD